MTQVRTPKKLIEVALPLDKINEACAREKSIRHGHPSTLHLWWARRPLAAARAVIFAQMVNDPGFEQGNGFRRGMNKQDAAIERERLFAIIEKLVLWENTNNETVLEEARTEIRKSWRETCELNKNHPNASELFNPEKLPAFHDPFAGGGAIPLEAQRLGLESYASDLNPVAVTINKAMIEIPPKFAGRKPVGPTPQTAQENSFETLWPGATGLAEDVRRYGAWMRERAQEKIGHLYPKVRVTPEMVLERPDLKAYENQDLTVIAWLWARTVKSPNPAFSHVDVPLASTFMLSTKEGKEAYVQPVIEGDTYRFTVKVGVPESLERATNGTKAVGRGANFICLLSDTPISGDYIKGEGQAGRMGARLMAIVAEGTRGRTFLPPNIEHEEVAHKLEPKWKPSGEVPARLTGGTCVPYGLREWGDLFSSRQLVALTTFSDSIKECVEKCLEDGVNSGFENDDIPLDAGGTGARAYAEAVGVYLAFAVDKAAEGSSTICSWSPLPSKLHVVSTFGRQALPMIWDYAESNVFADSSGNILRMCHLISEVIERQSSISAKQGKSYQANAAQLILPDLRVVSTDPPYYDNIAYADLSDFFYVWMRRSLRSTFPNLYATLAVPKSEELVATPYRHGGKDAAEIFFLDGMTHAIRGLVNHAHPAFPVTIYYAFKQSETTDTSGTSSTGWDTFLEAVIQAGFSVNGTWPVRTERAGGFRNKGQNALASSIVLVCRKRTPDALTISRREFIRELNATLPEALLEMTRGGVNSPVAPVDLSQAIIGPGMAIFSRYAGVLEADGTRMSVRTALQLINRFFAEDDFDADTQFCLHWFEEVGWAEGKYGEADVLARAKGTSVGGVHDAGVLESAAGKVRLLRWAELDPEWTPQSDSRTPVWEALHQLIRALNQESESAAGALLARMPSRTESMRALAYRLYTLCERQGWAEDARAYNEVIGAWAGIESAMVAVGPVNSQVPLDI
jgi:putative DNA methylase